MKVVILAGGTQSMLGKGQEEIPKPMTELGGKPLLWHIMKSFSRYGVREFVVCGGYHVDKIKEYFLDFYIYESDITVDLQSNTVEIHRKKTENWKVTVVDTGLYAAAGQRISRIQKYVSEDDFIVIYGDCLLDIDAEALYEAHKKSGKAATVVMAKPIGRNELLPIDAEGQLHYGNQITNNLQDNAWVNGNCFVFHKKVFDYLQGNYDLEKQLFVSLSQKQQLNPFPHRGFWMTIEAKRDLAAAENLWNAGMAPWVDLE